VQEDDIRRDSDTDEESGDAFVPDEDTQGSESEAEVMGHQAELGMDLDDQILELALPVPLPSPPTRGRPEVDSMVLENSTPTAADQPFMTGFKLLHAMDDGGTTEMQRLERKPMDVDRWELVISPMEYLERFRHTLATVQLINRAPSRTLHRTYHRGPSFDRWLLLAQANHQLWVNAEYKKDFFVHLNQYQTAQPGKLNHQASIGHAHVPTAVFIHCLSSAGCDSIRLKAYGQKMPLVDQFLHGEPAEVAHRWAEYNEWDIGTSFDSSSIWLFGSASGRKRQGLNRYPMMVPGSEDFGTVNVELQHQARHFSVKLYPRIVHVIKSFNSHLQGGIPKSLAGVKNQVNAGLKMIHDLTGKDDKSLGGFRIEVTVKAPSLETAQNLVKATPFMDPNFWLGQGPGPHSPVLLAARLVNRENFLANANWVYQQAQNSKILVGDNNSKPSRIQIQVLTDVLNGLGWNSGLRPATKSLKPDAWWNNPTTTAPEVFQVLSTLCQTDDQIKILFTIARDSIDCVPCKNHPDDPEHRYQVNSNKPFRVRCCMAGCYNKLQRSSLVHWIASLVMDETLDWEVFEEELKEALG